MKSVKSSNVNLKMNFDEQIQEIADEIVDFDNDKQIDNYWNEILSILIESKTNSKVNKIMRNLYAVSARICQTLAKPEVSEKFYEWSVSGLKNIKEKVDELSRTTKTQGEFKQTLSLLARALVVLKKSVLKYFAKPNSELTPITKALELQERIQALEGLLNQERSPTSTPTKTKVSKSVNKIPSPCHQKADGDKDFVNHRSEKNPLENNEEIVPFDSTDYSVHSKETLEDTQSPSKTPKSSSPEGNYKPKEPVSHVGESVSTPHPKIKVTPVPKFIEVQAAPNCASEEQTIPEPLAQLNPGEKITRSPKKFGRGKCLNAKSDTEYDSDNSLDTKHTEKDSNKSTPTKAVIPTPYRTRLFVKKEKRKNGKRVKIRENNNDVKEFFKRRKITTDFDFNPRFDTPKKSKKKRELKEKASDDSVLFPVATKGILKPRPSKCFF